VSYLFIAIVWVNHHHLLNYATEATPRLMWFNFAHLFSVSLLPLSTAWMALSELAPQPVAFIGSGQPVAFGQQRPDIIRDTGRGSIFVRVCFCRWPRGDMAGN
jgi:hypothetical protein